MNNELYLLMGIFCGVSGIAILLYFLWYKQMANAFGHEYRSLIFLITEARMRGVLEISKFSVQTALKLKVLLPEFNVTTEGERVFLVRSSLKEV